MNPPAQRRLLFVIATAYVLLAVLYSVSVPIFEASDELWHYPMVKYLVDNGLQLPPQDPANPGAWRQEGSQPPLYYMLAALLTAGIDTSDMEFVRRINPHADIGIVRPDGNANMIVHRAQSEAFPWRGTVLAVHIIRFFSVALGLGTVLVTYQLAREVFPHQPAIQLGAAALVAFLPMFLFISASVNNDNLSNLLGNLLTLLIVRLLRVTRLPQWRDYAVIGVVTGAGLLAKFNIGFLLPLVALALLVVSVRLHSWRPAVIGGVISGSLTLAIAGWWYWRNLQLYGDPTGINRFLDLVGRRAVPANAAQLWSERHSFTQAFWGFFGGVNVPMPEILYLIFNIVGGIGLVGVVTFLVHRIVTRTRRDTPGKIKIRWLPAAVTLIWPMITFVSYLRWTAETPASQGRLMFGALSSIMLWITFGLVWWLPEIRRAWLLVPVVAYFLAIAALIPPLVIAPAYRAPLQTVDADAVETFGTNEVRVIHLIEARVVSDVVRPEQYVHLETVWSMASATDRNWSLFVHLVTPDGVIVGQRDVYPGAGLLATSDLIEGSSWVHPVAVWVPFTAYAPMRLDVRVGWYHHPTGERFRTASGEESFMVGQVELLPRESNLDVPNPIQVNFAGLLELVGYSLTDLSPAAGDTIELTLYWRAIQAISDDYKVFANVLDPKTLTKYAASDGMPVQWTRPTSTWQPGEIIEDVHTLDVSVDALPGIYELELGVYREAPDGTFPRLRVFTPDGGQADNFVYLSRMRILPREVGF